jgi:hypothetical protein
VEGSQSNAVSADIEVSDVGKADRESPTWSCAFLVIIEANCGGVVEQEMGIDWSKPRNEAKKSSM